MIGKKTAAKEQVLSRLIIESAGDIAQRIKAQEVFVILQGRDDYERTADQIKKLNAVPVVRGKEFFQEVLSVHGKAIKVPDIKLTRMGQIKVAVMLAMSGSIIKPGDRIVCVTGVASFGNNDSIVVIDTGKELEIFSSANLLDIPDSVRADVFETVLKLAMELAARGREGKSVGTIFVLGDEERVLQLSRQLIINPFKGYSEEELSVHDPQLRDAIKEFSAIDGAFVIRGDGVLITAGRHLNAALEEEDMPKGLGSRHVAAAGITSLTEAIAIVISESAGTVRIFKKGRVFMEIERPPIGA
ncbi:MAG: diadenylate cyclase [Deltaproteobacteria bacterium]|nr:diadenylate cyclase [Candidatus Zymogenaceae bacterium]